MRAFVFDHAELLCMSEETIRLFKKLLTPELILKLSKVIYSEKFQIYKDDSLLNDSVIRLEDNLKSVIVPVTFMESLRTETFPNSELSYFHIISTEFSVLLDKLFLFEMEVCKLEEISEKLTRLMEVINYVPSSYKPGKKEDFEKFYNAVKEEVKPSAIALNRLTGVPYNKNLIQELSANKSVLYDKNARARASGYSHIANRSETIGIILEGYKWNIYCKKSGLDYKRILNFI